MLVRAEGRLLLTACLTFLLCACETQHIITLRPDRSATIRNSSTGTGLHIPQYYISPAVAMVDTSVWGNSIVMIKDIDSLGGYLPTFDPHQLTVTLHDKELSVNFNTAPLLKGWSGSRLTFFIEQGIEKALPSKRKVRLDGNYATIRIRRRLLRTSPTDLNFTLLIRDPAL